LFDFSTIEHFYPHELHLVSVGVVSAVVLLHAALELGFVRTAVPFLLYGAFWGASVGLAWQMYGAETLFTHFPEEAWTTLTLLGIGSVGATALVFLLHTRSAIPRAISLNPTAIDFEKMEFHALGPFDRPDGKRSISLSSLLALSLLGIPLAGLIPAGTFEDVLFIAVSWFLGYAFIGYAAVGNIYQAWLINQKCAAVGKTMVVSELKR
jgi:hypothetical protein